MEKNNKQIQPTDEMEKRFLNMMERLWNFSANQLPAEELDLTMAQLRMIDFISKNVGCHLQDVADGLQLTPPTVSVGIRKLEEGGWLERCPDPDDGRATCVYLTSQSEAAIQKTLTHQQKIRNLFFAGLTDSEEQVLLDLLEKGILSVEGQILK